MTDRLLDRDWTRPVRYPDPAIEHLDRRFARYRVGSAALERIWTGGRWNEGPVWFGDLRSLIWSDIPNDRMLRWCEDSGEVSVFRQPSNNANGNTRDRQGRLLTCEHRQAEAATDRRALHRGDHWLCVREKPHRLLVQRIATARHRVVNHRRPAIVEVGARAKGLAFRAQHDRTTLDNLVQVFKRIGQIADQGVVEEIVRRSTDLELRDIGAQGYRDITIAFFQHCSSLRSGPWATHWADGHVGS